MIIEPWGKVRHDRFSTPDIRRYLVLVFLLPAALAPGNLRCAVGAESQPDRLPRDNLLLYYDQHAAVRPVRSPADWQIRRDAIKKGMQQVMGLLPDRGRLGGEGADIQVLEEVDAGSYVRRLITFQSEPHSRTPAYLCVPKDIVSRNKTTAGVLCLHPTDNVVGHKVVVGLGGRPGRQYASELAERGYVTIAPAYPHLANYWPHLERLGYDSGTMKAIWDNMRALDVLAAQPSVDESRGYAAIGHSLGGHNAIYTAVFDERIKVVVSSCGFDSYLDYYDGDEANWYFGKGWCQIRYMPRLSNYRGRLREIPFDFHELLGAIAPRPVFINAPLHDGNFRWRSVDDCVAAARPVYELLGGDGRLVVRHPDCGHDFPAELRREAYEFIDAALNPEGMSKNSP